MEIPNPLEPILEAITAPLEAVGETISHIAPPVTELDFGPALPEIAALTGESVATGLYDACIHPEYVDPYISDTFSLMRDTAHYAQAWDIDYRLSFDPQPTETEFAMGCYVEELEPQVRDAVMTMWEKGYSTNSSGFYGHGHNLQVIDGPFDISPTLAESLYANFGVSTEKIADQTWLGFWMSPADTLDSITSKWNAIADFLPRKEEPSLPSRSYASDMFRLNHTHPRANDTLDPSDYAKEASTGPTVVATGEAAPLDTDSQPHRVIGRAGLVGGGLSLLASSILPSELDDERKRRQATQ